MIRYLYTPYTPQTRLPTVVRENQSKRWKSSLGLRKIQVQSPPGTISLFRKLMSVIIPAIFQALLWTNLLFCYCGNWLSPYMCQQSVFSLSSMIEDIYAFWTPNNHSRLFRFIILFLVTGQKAKCNCLECLICTKKVEKGNCPDIYRQSTETGFFLYNLRGHRCVDLWRQIKISQCIQCLALI